MKNTNTTAKDKILSFFTLFTSTGTLLCCALPALLAAVAGGSAVASLISAAPWLIPLSQHKGWIFIVAGILLAFTALFTLRPQSKLVCAINGGEGCATANSFSKFMLYVSLGIYTIGFFFAYLLTPLLRFLDGAYAWLPAASFGLGPY